MPRIAVLDDDPTGSQTVHDVAIVMALDEDELRLSGDTTFFLTNTRSLPEAEAAALTERVGAHAVRAPSGRRDRVSRSDSTLRGHVVGGDRGDRPRAASRAGRATTASCWSRRSSRPGASRAATSTTPATRPWGRPSSRATPRSATRARTSSTSCAEKTAREEPVAAASVGGAPRTLARRGRLDRRQRRVLLTISKSSCAGVRDSGRRFLYRTGPSFVRALAGPAPPSRR